MCLCPWPRERVPPLHCCGWDAIRSQLRAGHGVPGGRGGRAQRGNAARRFSPSPGPLPRVLLGVWSGADCSLALWETAPQHPCETPAPAGSGAHRLPAHGDAVSMWGGPRLPTPGCSGRCKRSSRASRLQHPLVNNRGHETDKGHRNTESNRAKGQAQLCPPSAACKPRQPWRSRQRPPDTSQLSQIHWCFQPKPSADHLSVPPQTSRQPYGYCKGDQVFRV